MILDKIADGARVRVEKQKAIKPRSALRAAAEKKSADSVDTGGLVFEKALSGKELSFICEVKKASPSKGIIAGDFPYVSIALEYEAAGASAISCLTEPEFFQGSDCYLQEIKERVRIPVLRKDFTIDEYQIFEAVLLGADAVLLICALLDEKKLAEFIRIAWDLRLSALVETHNADEVKMAIGAGARVIGINNRDLKTFTVDLGTTQRLRPLIPEGLITVSESGVASNEDIKRIRRCGIDAVLIGESMMKAGDKKRYLEELARDERLV
jgi:indole-3-glycerol phosphate synthase